MKKMFLIALISGLSLFAADKANVSGEEAMEVTAEEYSVIIHEEIDSFSKKLPLSLGSPNVQLYAANIEKDTINYSVKLNLKAFEKDSKMQVNSENLPILTPAILGSFRNAQVSGLCTNEDTLKIFKRGYSIQYSYEFDNGVKIGANKINLNTCKSIYQKSKQLN